MEFRSIFRNLFSESAEQAQNTDVKTNRLEYLNDYETVFCKRDDYSNDILIKTCIDTISKHVSKLNCNHVIVKNDTKAPAQNTMLNDILTLNPNPFMTSHDFLYRVCSNLLTNKNSYISISRDRAGNVTALWPLDFMSVEPRELDGEIFLKFTFKNGNKKTLSYKDVIHIRHNFSDGELISHTYDNLDDNMQLLDILQQSFKNHAINTGKIKGIAKIAGQSGSDAWQKKAKQLNSNLQDPAAGGIVCVDGTLDFIPVTSQPEAADTAQLKFIRDNIYNYFGVSESIINGKYTEQEWQAFFESTIEPIAIALSQEFTRKIFTQAQRLQGNQIYFDANRLAYADTKTKVELIRQLRPLGILTTNQALEIMDLPPVADGDDRVQTLNVANTDIVNDYQLNNIKTLQHKAGGEDNEEDN